MSDFLPAVQNTLEWEGGYINDPADPGGETNFGISKRSYPSIDIKNLTRNGAIEIYGRDFWDLEFNKFDNQDIANKVFDMKVNFGVAGYLPYIERSLHYFGWPASPGTSFQPLMTQQINKTDPRGFLIELRAQSAMHYTNLVLAKPAKLKFLGGWLRRAVS